MSNAAAPDDLAGKVVLVTGASSGIGEHVARLLATRKAKVAVAARRTELLAKLTAEVRAAGGTMLPVSMDIGSVESIDSGIARIEAELGPIDALLNNAGVLLEGRAVDVTEPDFDRLFTINVKGTFFVSQAVAKRMITRKTEGAIVSIASVAGLVTMPLLGVYGMTKAALVQMTKAFAQEWARHGLRVNAICPGFVATDMNAEFFASPPGEKMIQRLPKRRVATIDALDELLLLLLSQGRSRFMNGAIITVDDGYSVS